MPDMSVIRTDFDQIAPFEGDAWNHNNAYHTHLLRQLPAHVGQSLDVGCGIGEFARLLAERSDYVTGFDLSPEMIRLAKERSTAYPNIDYQVTDVLAQALPPDRFDVIASIATLHHLPLEAILARLKPALKPGGVLVILDLLKDESVIDYLCSAVALPLDMVVRRLHHHGGEQSPEARAAWEKHGKNDTYLTLSQVRSACRSMLPGAIVRRHLFWRYSITWRRSG